MIEIDVILLVGAVVLIAAIIAARIGARIGLPSLLLFLGLGLVMGESGIGISFDNADLAQALAFAALVVILAEGGLTTRWSDIRSSTVLAALLATVGVLISVGLMTLFGHYVLGLPLWIAVLLGAVTSPTDAAAVFSVLRTVPIPRSLRGALEAESGLNDAPTVLLVMLASSYAVGNPVEFGIPGLIGLILLEMIGGLVIGGGLGWLGAQILRRVALPSSGLYPLAILVWTVFAYGITALVHASGFAAVYVCALVLGNLQLPHRAATRSFVEGIGWIAQIGLFVMLGLLAFPDRVTPQCRSDRCLGGPGPDPGCPACLSGGMCGVVQDPGPASSVSLLGGSAWSCADRAGHDSACPRSRRCRIPFRCGVGLCHRLHLPPGSNAAVGRPPAGAGGRWDSARRRSRGCATRQDLS